MKKSITHYWQNLNPVSIILLPVSLVFCSLVKLRRFAYAHHWLTISYFKLPVIVVGNIYVGGSGKTPLVIWLADQLKRHGFKPAIVSRGYSASAKGTWPREVILNGAVTQYGDEPYLIKKQTQCPVIIDPLRSRAVHKIQQDYDCDVIISDDGLQHYAMSRYIEINITDSKKQYGNHLCLPAGPLREPRSRLSQVDYIIYNQTTGQCHQAVLAANEFLMRYDFELLFALDEKTPIRLETFKQHTVHAIAGIGDPERFFDLLKRQGLEVIKHAFSDHHIYEEHELVFSDPYPVIMTEKDAVKCAQFKLTNCWYLPIKARINGTLIEKIITKLRDYHG